jgi:hypothetical protein
MRKRFLSLLLALTMVLSLTVVPARANGTDITVANAIQSVTYNGVTEDVKTSNGDSVDCYTTGDSLSTTANEYTVKTKSGYVVDTSDTNEDYTGGKKVATESGGSGAATLKVMVKKNEAGSTAQELSITLNKKKISAPTVTVKYESTPGNSKAYEGQTITFTASAPTGSGDVAYPTGVSYVWSYKKDGDSSETPISKTTSTIELAAPEAGTYNIYCKVKLPGNAGTTAANTNTTFTTVDDPYSPYNNGSNTYSYSLVDGETVKITAPTLKAKDNNPASPASDVTVEWDSTDKNVATVGSNGVVTPGTKSGTTTVTATIKYQGKTYPSLKYTITVKALDIELGSITNGDYESYDDGYFAKLLADKINSVKSTNITVNSVTLESGGSSRLTFTEDKYNGASVTNLYAQDFRINAAAGCIGEQTFQVKVNGSYVVTLTVPVESDGELEETVTGTTASSSVSFDVDDVTSGDYLYIYGTGSKTSFSPSSLSSTSTGYDGYWNGASAKSGWVRFDEDDTITIPASKFSSGKVTLYVVSLDSYGVATTGTIEVSQKDYSIKYNVVAGESVSFEQDDFEDFLEEYAEDNSNYDSRKDELVFDYAVLTSSIPSSKNEGTLYYGSTEITSSNKSKTEMEDMDKASFDAVAKAKDTVTMTFRVYGDLYKNGASKATEVKYDVDVVISVVKEDIVYTVGVNSSVKFDDDDFQDYLNDYSSSYRKSTLSYVTFEVGRNSAISAYFSGTGALYRYYSAYGTSSAVSGSDEFYYELRSSSKNYDLADVTYVTTRFAKAGDTVYIPFTAYGTKSEKVTGTVAIKIKQTMNFTDVHTYDYFYDSVQWAVNNNVTAGTSATTFSPSQSCTRAQIVTFLWRAAGSPEPRSTSNPFTDVSATRDADYYKAILWAVENKITTGTSATTFSPSGTCTRAQIVTFLYRYKGSPSVSGSLSFTDVSKTTHSAYYNAILWAVRNSVTTGNGNNTFAPSATCNRGEAVTFLYRALA